MEWQSQHPAQICRSRCGVKKSSTLPENDEDVTQLYQGRRSGSIQYYVVINNTFLYNLSYGVCFSPSPANLSLRQTCSVPHTPCMHLPVAHLGIDSIISTGRIARIALHERSALPLCPNVNPQFGAPQSRKQESSKVQVPQMRSKQQRPIHFLAASRIPSWPGTEFQRPTIPKPQVREVGVTRRMINRRTRMVRLAS